MHIMLVQQMRRNFQSEGHVNSKICRSCRRIQVRYSKDPHTQNSIRTLKLTLTLTLTDTGGAVLTLMLGYRSLYITWQ